MKLIDEFRTFIARGSVVDMAVGIALGSAFAAIARSLVDDLIMPPIGLVFQGEAVRNLFTVLRAGDPPPPYLTLADAQAAGAITINFGVFLNAIVSFLIIAAAIFLLVRTINRLRARQELAPAEPTDKTCPFCRVGIPLQATRCPHCTSRLEGA